jgi:hypothetical protein
METPAKHYRFVNSNTGNTIYHYSVDANLAPAQVIEQLDVIKAQVAVTNRIFLETVYWEEVRDDD